MFVLLAMNNGMTSCRLHCVVAWISTIVGLSNVHGLSVMPAVRHTKNSWIKNKWTVQRWTTSLRQSEQSSLTLNWPPNSRQHTTEDKQQGGGARLWYDFAITLWAQSLMQATDTAWAHTHSKIDGDIVMLHAKLINTVWKVLYWFNGLHQREFVKAFIVKYFGGTARIHFSTETAALHTAYIHILNMD